MTLSLFNTRKEFRDNTMTTSNQELQNRKTKVIARGQGNMYPVYVERAENSEIWDVEGNRYIDFLSLIHI